MKTAVETLTLHAAATLPTDLNQRKVVLVAMLRVLKSSHRAYAHIQRQLSALETIEKLQVELPLQFTLTQTGGSR